MMNKILFVDDDQNILRGLRRVLRVLNGEWEMSYAGSGQEALQLLAQQDFDIVVSDYRMPEMNGYELLSCIHQDYPQIIRIMLTGQPDKETYTDSISICHYFLWKPLSIEDFKPLLLRLRRLDGLIANIELRKILGGLTALPTLPEVYLNLTRLLSDPDADNAAIVAMIRDDVSLSIQVLKAVNSSCYGLMRKITVIEEAICYIGLNTLRSMVLMHHIFRSDSVEKNNVAMQELWHHSLCTAHIAEALVASSGDRDVAAMASFSGLLHDIGKLILAYCLPEQYERIAKISAENNIDMNTAEIAVLGADHAEIGAYLMLLWGLPEQIIETVYRHHHSECPASDVESGIAAAVWHANRISNGIIDQSMEEFNLLQQDKYINMLNNCFGGTDGSK